MSILIVQFSDIHFRAKSNPILGRQHKLFAAIESIVPRPSACLLLVTGDVAWSGQPSEYLEASVFFDAARSRLGALFSGAFASIFIPGNHDCCIPEQDTVLRAAVIAGVEPSLQTARPDQATINSLLSVQDNFYAFEKGQSGEASQGMQKICKSVRMKLGNTEIRINTFNTALLTQRKEAVGSLSLPLLAIEKIVTVDTAADLTISLHHHPDEWLEPSFRRSFRKLLESTSHFVFTGHEHEHESYLVESSTGEQVQYVEADALQDEQNPSKSGFNCLVIDPASRVRRYYLFRWKSERYTAQIDGVESPLYLLKKSSATFLNNERFQRELREDSFGFTHKSKSRLLLEDFFVYPALSVSPVTPGTKATKVRGADVVEYLLKERYLLLQGADLCGKTALLKTLYKDLAEGTTLVPVLLEGQELSSAAEANFFDRVWSTVRIQYSPELVEPYKQLPIERRALLIDDWHKSRLSAQNKQLLITFAKKHFGLVVIASNDVVDVSEVYSLETNSLVKPLLQSAKLNELSASVRGELVDRWLRIGRPDAIEELSLSKDREREQGVLDYLIGKKTLPSLPYLILGVLQARQHQNDGISDPGSFGFLIQKLVLDALTVSKGKRKLIERKDAILRRCSFEMFRNGITSLSLDEFKGLVADYALDIKISVDIDEILDDLLFGRILVNLDGNLEFKYKHFYHYFLARHFIDEIEGPRAAKIREYLDGMADRPLTKSNQLTLIFFLFFKKRDPVIDRIISQADATFSTCPLSDMISDTKFVDAATPTLKMSHVDTKVDTAVERQKRLENQDKLESRAESNDQQRSLDLQYDDNLDFQHRARFANARLELLGQVIRSFPDSLDGAKKVEILEATFRLGLRYLGATLALLEQWLLKAIKQIGDQQDFSQEQRNASAIFVREVITLFVRGCCDAMLLTISRAVGTSDLEVAYSEAINKVGITPSTSLIDLAIKLDHSEGFPFKDVQHLKKSLPEEGAVALAVLSDLVVRHTQVFTLRQDTLRKIAGLIGIKAVSLYDNLGD
jgi:predicted MPP superfamily phosphohydrolase